MKGQSPVFDDIAENYDSTRKTLDGNEVSMLISALEDCVSVLEIGVGTGRILKPLQDHGFDVTGLDISEKMMQKAMEKGVKHLVIGNAESLPFLDKSFDATLLIHVFHLVDPMEAVMQEAKRVTKKHIVSFITERVPAPNSEKRPNQGSLKIFQEVAEKNGYPVELKTRYFKKRDEDILSVFPPSRKIFVGKYVTKRKPENFVDRFRYSSRFVSVSKKIPQKTIEKILLEVKEEISKQSLETIEQTILEYIALWDVDTV
jgi:ubiquinone/menaquinone biosynthesis C-methylase UbiE